MDLDFNGEILYLHYTFGGFIYGKIPIKDNQLRFRQSYHMFQEVLDWFDGNIGVIVQGI